MIDSFTTLISSIITWADHDEINTSVATDLLTLGEKRVYRDVRVRSMESTLSVTIAGGVATLPADFIGLKHVQISGNPDQPLGVVTDEFIYAKYPNRSSESKPLFCAVEGDNLIFGPYPDSGYTVKGIYYKRLTALSASNTTNFFTGDGVDALFWASLAESEPFLKNDSRLQIWEMKYQDAKRSIMKEQNKLRFATPKVSRAR